MSKTAENVLPLDIWSRVFVCLDVVHRARFRRVCKGWEYMMGSTAVSSIVKFNLTALNRFKWWNLSGPGPTYLTNETKTIVFTTDLAKDGWVNWKDFRGTYLKEWPLLSTPLEHVLGRVPANGRIEKIVVRGVVMDTRHAHSFVDPRHPHSFVDICNRLCIKPVELVFIQAAFGDLHHLLPVDLPVCYLALDINDTIVLPAGKTEEDYLPIFAPMLNRFSPELSDEEYALVNDTLWSDPGWDLLKSEVASHMMEINSLDVVPDPPDTRILNRYLQRQLVVIARNIHTGDY